MKVVVENTVCLNTGDAAILFAIRHILKSILGEKVEFLVFDSQPEVAARLYPKEQYPDIELRKLPSESIFKYKYDDNTVKNALKQVYNQAVFHALRHLGCGNYLDRRFFSDEDRKSLALYKDADLVITTGGTYLVENYSLERRINQFKLGEMLGKKTIFFTQSLGPFEKPYNRRMLPPIFARSPLILLRDARSRNHILDLVDDPSKCHVVADSVFALADVERIKALLMIGRPAPTRRVGISVRHWHYVKGGDGGMGRYIDSVREIATKLVRDHGKKVTFISTCQGVPEYAHDDSKTANLIVSGLAPEIAEHVSVDASFHTPEQLMAIARGLDFVVATRMHMMIMSLCVGTPVLPIAYEFKTKEVAKRVGVDDVLLDIDTVTPEEASGKLDRFVGKLDHYRETSLKAVLEEHASAMSAADQLRPVIEGLSAYGAHGLRKDVEQDLARLA
ncbi:MULTISPECIES: polysaccharide pyruvyl transferase family protein [unclassified Sinorhizobium]|uniref:polysaccharide pyruvyl transferase family protein n=1 Tax=unclassified Sinorhizobium TaxID=2613772 RepID=UPI0024C444EC|nr:MULTISPECIES: polysaccharide pyruvyl transferase family protein [unclassified Sinorhizobium]MDK1374296.1 polysaccharide pyruvyl transferase family protein [Sinorhizobium sp. 6-70]MDK1479440.1 polysaccharide pyruvyl transferase family protein [Sinorhizobium sp. 6-117]